MLLSIDIHAMQYMPFILHEMTFDLIFSVLLNVWHRVNDLRIWVGKNRVGQ